MKKLIAKFLVPVCALVLVASVSGDTVVEEIIARVNDQIITRSEYQDAREQTAQELKQRNAPADETDKDLRNVLRSLIDQQLLIQKGKDLGIDPEAEVIKRLDEMRKQMGLESMEDLEKAASQQGVSFEDYKQKMKNDIITQHVISEEVGRRVTISPEETQTFYDQHKEQFDHPEQVDLSEILISTDKSKKNPSDDEQQRAILAEAAANKAYSDLQAGAKFPDEAKKDSDGATAAQGGDLGPFQKGQLAPEIEQQVFSLKTGGYTKPVRTKQGYLILHVDRHLPAGVPPLKDVNTEVQNAIYAKKLEPALRDYLTKLREDAFIEIKAGYLDTGASPNQTRPTYTTTAEENTKKLEKKKKKLGIF